MFGCKTLGSYKHWKSFADSGLRRTNGMAAMPRLTSKRVQDLHPLNSSRTVKKLLFGRPCATASGNVINS